MNPGGKPEPGESARQTLCRELAEEIGLQVDPIALEPWGRYETDAANEPGHSLGAECFLLRVADPAHAVAAEIAESTWVDPAKPVDVELAPLAERFLLPRAAALMA